MLASGEIDNETEKNTIDRMNQTIKLDEQCKLNFHSRIHELPSFQEIDI